MGKPLSTTDDEGYVFVKGGFKVHEKFVCHYCEEAKLAAEELPVEAEERLSLDVYAGRYCDDCWEKSGYRKEGYEGFSKADAGEAYWEDDY